MNDTRIERSKEHLLKDIIAIAILAIISGADGWVGIEAYGNAKYEWLKSFLELPNGIPSQDTFSRVLARIEPQQFQECFWSWVNAIVGELEPTFRTPTVTWGTDWQRLVSCGSGNQKA